MARRTAAVTAAFLALVASGARAQALEPSPYLQFSDSPFFGGSFSYFHLEDFEDGLLNTPGVTLSAGVVSSPGGSTDSVDADDGTIDGFGQAGRSLYSNNTESEFTFTFDGVALGGLPTHVGLVWTDVGNVLTGNPGFGPVAFDVFDSSLTLIDTVDGGTLGDASSGGETPEDRFFGYISAGGIGRVTMRMANSVDWEVDHLQYGRAGRSAAAPEPSALALLVAPVAFLLRRRG